MINTEKSQSQNTVTTTVTRLCDAAASAPTVQACETFCAFEKITEPMTAEKTFRKQRSVSERDELVITEDSKPDCSYT